MFLEMHHYQRGLAVVVVVSAGGGVPGLVVVEAAHVLFIRFVLRRFIRFDPCAMILDQRERDICASV